MNRKCIESSKVLYKTRIATSIALASSVGLYMPVPHAQEQVEGRVLEELIVTVERREQSLQDFAGTAQVFDTSELDKSGVGSDFSNLQVVIPGLQISENEGFKEIYIRGIGTQANSPTDDSATAVHLNGVYLPRSRGIGPMFYDLERVEANKGPQGTLRGRNATAGSINFITKRPELDDTNGYVKLGGGNFGSKEYEGAINIPFGETFAMRAAVFHRENDNIYDNVLQSGTVENVDGVGAIEEDAFRISAFWQPNDNFSALLTYDSADIRGQGSPGNYFGQAFSDGFTIDSLDDPYLQHFQTRGLVTNDIEGFNLVLEYDFGPFALEYNAGYREHDAFNRNSRRPFQFGVANPAITDTSQILTLDLNNFGTNHILDTSEALVHELRLVSSDDARFRWSAGLFSLDEDQYETRFDTSDKSLTQNSLGGEGYSINSIKAKSIFADGTFDLTDTWRVKGGVRYTEDDKSSLGFQTQYNFAYNVDPNTVRFSTPGYLPTAPGDRKYIDPNNPNVSAADFFLDGVGQFGANDTLGQLIATDPSQVSLTTTANAGLNLREFDEEYVDWRLGVEHDLSDDHLIYASVTTGSRSGGLNPIIRLANGELANSSFDREKLTSWELGSKNSFDINGVPVRFNANLFLYQYDDQVLQVAGVAQGGGFTPGATNVNANLVTRNVNIAESEILGLELEGGALLPHGFNVGWNIALLDSEYKDATVLDGRPSPAGYNVDITGNRLLNVSDVNAVVYLGQDIDAGWGTVDWRLTASYRSEFNSTPYEGQGYDPNTGNPIPLSAYNTCCFPSVSNGSFYNDTVDAFTLWNLNVGLNFGSLEQYRVEAYVNNITEEAYATKQIINHFVNIAFLNNPRMAGIRFRADF